MWIAKIRTSKKQFTSNSYEQTASAMHKVEVNSIEKYIDLMSVLFLQTLTGLLRLSLRILSNPYREANDIRYS